ncbi:phosphotransferase [Cryptosporangium sp. NPDC051539]|uniref:phosphotransferase n=1 Tax=Cryptosporangium sp. NPDC051539 TaxID=3363962 RepID=UPI00379C8D9A
MDGSATASGPFASGRDADVYALDDRRVLRRYRRGGDVSAEAALMRHLGAARFPVPEVYEAEGPDLVLERIDGPTMLRAVAEGTIAPGEAAQILADLHARLHAVPPLPGTSPGEWILHLDLHPENVLLGPDGPVLIDWRNARSGPPDLDTALSAVILAQAAIDPGRALAEPAAALLAAFLRRAPGTPLSRLDEALSRRRDDRGTTAVEKARLPRAEALIRGHA